MQYNESYAENVWRHNRVLIGGMLILVGLLMLLAEKVGRQSKGIGRVGLVYLSMRPAGPSWNPRRRRRRRRRFDPPQGSSTI